MAKRNHKKTLVNEIASSQWSRSSRCCLNNQNKVASNMRGKAGGGARVTAGPKRPHLSVCPGLTLFSMKEQASGICQT